MGTLEKMFLSVADHHAPALKTKRLRNKKPWTAQNLRKLVVQRHNLKHIAVNSNTDADWTNYKKKKASP